MRHDCMSSLPLCFAIRLLGIGIRIGTRVGWLVRSLVCGWKEFTVRKKKNENKNRNSRDGVFYFIRSASGVILDF